MHDGKKSVAQRSFYSAMDIIAEKITDKEISAVIFYTNTKR